MIIKEINLNGLVDEYFEINPITITIKEMRVEIQGDFNHVFGFGEKYNTIDHKQTIIENKVVEQFCYQNEKTYLPLPFFFLDCKVGIFIKTRRAITFDLSQGINIDISNIEDDAQLYVLNGSYDVIIKDFIDLTGDSLLPPKWAFGPWMSAHRWNSQKIVDEQLNIIEKLDFPFTTIVLEQWSDESTFYIFNQAEYRPKEGNHNYNDFSFKEDAKWPNPKQMIDNIHQKGLRLILWQVSAVKALEPHEPRNIQHEIDQIYVVKNNLVAKHQNESPYTIPEGHWFKESYIPDFSNQKMYDWWFGKRKYLLDIGVDGFKTDGGEFVYNDEIKFSNGLLGKDMINQYPKDYIEAYHRFVGKDRALFSRAGYIGQQSVTINWAGDQKSTWDEFRNIYRAGINASLSGQAFWSFDIGGFAGDLPSLDLYIRSTQMALFTPVMQFHSEPVGGQFALLDASKVMNNERTPWNIVKQNDREDLIPMIRNLYWLRMNLLPYIYSESIKAVEEKKTLMKHLMIDFHDDSEVIHKHDQYLFGDLMVAPVLEENLETLNVYFPKGTWHDLMTGQTFLGNKHYDIETSIDKLHVYIKDGDAIILNMSDDQLPSKVSNTLNYDANLVLWLFGKEGSYVYKDETYDCQIDWNQDGYQIKGNYPKTMKIVYK